MAGKLFHHRLSNPNPLAPEGELPGPASLILLSIVPTAK